MLGHPIDLTSKLGRGSVFSITLPVSTGRAFPRTPAHTPRPLTYGQFDGSVVLCVDNEPAILDGMRSMLENWHCQVLQAAGGAEAVQLIARTGLRPISSSRTIIWSMKPASTASMPSAPSAARKSPVGAHHRRSFARRRGRSTPQRPASAAQADQTGWFACADDAAASTADGGGMSFRRDSAETRRQTGSQTGGPSNGCRPFSPRTLKFVIPPRNAKPAAVSGSRLKT